MNQWLLSLSAGVGSSEHGAGLSVEHELIERALAGDGRAFQSLVEPHLAMLYRIASRACGNSALSEDAVQEALTIAFTRLGSYSAGTSLKAFLASIAVKRARTLLRSERRRRGYEERSRAGERVPEPSEIVETKQSARAVRDALAAMPDKRREVALLRLDANLSYAEIAAALGTTEGSARVLAHLALSELKTKLSNELGTPNPEKSR
ncbi:MAG TPA: sigma-70 family RNA polymerase sigma factor [Polyangiaceae bacterium]|jgi:RNA polymerase sigma-70 factor (ECF subfamily)|nr:sigma-70 family RNA polymerase sigma factor [Polyangiaceae bacterium]